MGRLFIISQLSSLPLPGSILSVPLLLGVGN